MKKLIVCLLALGLAGCNDSQPLAFGTEAEVNRICAPNEGTRHMAVRGNLWDGYTNTTVTFACRNGLRGTTQTRSINGTPTNRSKPPVEE